MYFFVGIKSHGVDITEYETLNELEECEAYYIDNYNDFYIIKGDKLELKDNF